MYRAIFLLGRMDLWTVECRMLERIEREIRGGIDCGLVDLAGGSICEFPLFTSQISRTLCKFCDHDLRHLFILG